MKLLKDKITPNINQIYFYSVAILILRLDLVFLNTMPTGETWGPMLYP